MVAVATMPDDEVTLKRLGVHFTLLGRPSRANPVNLQRIPLNLRTAPFYYIKLVYFQIVNDVFIGFNTLAYTFKLLK